MLEHIIPSKTRRKILKLFYEHIGESYHLRKVGREIDEEINAVKRELDILAEAKVLLREKRLNKVIYSLNNKFLFYNEFLNIFAKESAFIQKILKNVPRLGKIKFIVFSQKFIKKQRITQGEIYLLLVGVVVIPEIVAIIGDEEKEFGYEINYTVMTEEEFAFRKKNNDPFMWGFLKQPKLMIHGNEEELMK